MLATVIIMTAVTLSSPQAGQLVKHRSEVELFLLGEKDHPHIQTMAVMVVQSKFLVEKLKDKISMTMEEILRRLEVLHLQGMVDPLD